MGSNQRLTPDLARRLLAGSAQLVELFGMGPAELRDYAASGGRLWQQGRRHDAERVFRNLVALDEAVYYGHAGLGAAALEQGILVEAEAHLRCAAACAGPDEMVFVNLGEVLVRMGKIEEGRALLEKASTSIRAKGILDGL